MAAIRQVLLLTLDDLFVAARKFINSTVSRSGHGRCQRRHGVSNLEEYEPGFLHEEVKYRFQMQSETQCRYFFAAIDRASLWVYVDVLTSRTNPCAPARAS